MKQNKEQFKRLLIFIISLVIISAFAVLFANTWYTAYNSEMRDPFWQKGNILLIMIYVMIYTIVTRSVNGFKVTYLRKSALFGSHGAIRQRMNNRDNSDRQDPEQ